MPEFVRKAQELKRGSKDFQGQTDWRIFTEKEWTQRQYGYDADEEVDKWWQENKEGKAKSGTDEGMRQSHL